MQIARPFKASDPRDKIYALLGLAFDHADFPGPSTA
jgi:hypothetical protein